MSFSKRPPSDSFTQALRETTPARIGIGHAGGRYLTAAQLKFKEDLAASKDAVRREVADNILQPLGLITLQSRAVDRPDYLMNSAAGRLLDESSVERLKREGTPQPDIQLIVSDGLSCEAFENNVPEMLPLLEERLRAEKLTVGKTIFVRFARVAVIDHVGEILRPRASLILIGERPGLGISDSLSGYFEYAPHRQRVESDRNVLSNIHQKGIPAKEAALMLAEALIEVLRIQKSGMTVRFDFT